MIQTFLQEMAMATETKSVEWIDERTLAKIVSLKVATVSWECGASGEGCTISYSSPVVLKKHKCPRNMNHLAKSSASWLWAFVAAVAAIIALFATRDGAAIYGLGFVGWVVIAGASAGISAVAVLLLQFDEKYEDAEPLPFVEPTRRFDVTVEVSSNCTEELARLWAQLLRH